MPKHFFRPDERQGDFVTLRGEPAHHFLNVLRMGVGDEVILCDGNGMDFCARIVEIHPGSRSQTVVFEVGSETPSLGEPSVPIVLYQSVPKGDKLDLIIQKCVELGVAEIVPVVTERSVSRLRNGKDEGRKTVRYQRIAEAAAGQCMRGVIPVVRNALSFDDAVNDLHRDMLCVVAYEQELERSLKSVICERWDGSGQVCIWIGPEGGFTDGEIETLSGQGVVPVSLGRRILRTETAAIAAVAQIVCLCE